MTTPTSATPLKNCLAIITIGDQDSTTAVTLAIVRSLAAQSPAPVTLIEDPRSQTFLENRLQLDSDFSWQDLNGVQGQLNPISVAAKLPHWNGVAVLSNRVGVAANSPQTSADLQQAAHALTKLGPVIIQAHPSSISEILPYCGQILVCLDLAGINLTVLDHCNWILNSGPGNYAILALKPRLRFWAHTSKENLKDSTSLPVIATLPRNFSARHFQKEWPKIQNFIRH